jgi:glycosyltransferase involved in cell wall biosynthesis
MPRVLHVISQLDPRTGGPATALLGLASAQADVGLAVSVVSGFKQSPDESVGAALARHGVNVRWVGPVRGKLNRHPDLGQAAQEAAAAADVVHVHAMWEEIQHRAARAAQQRGVPYVIRPCGMLDPWSLRQSRWVKQALLAWRVRRNLRRAAALHFTTTAERDLTAPLKLGVPAIVEPNGVDLAEFDRLPSPGTFRGAQPQLGDRPFVLFLSRLHPKKGLDLLVPAFARVAGDPRMAGVTLVVAGPDEAGYRTQVEALASQEGIGGRVLFPGMLKGEQRLAALAEAKLFVLPSYQENFGNAVIEALAAGTPVVISDQVNLHPEITGAGVGGVVPTRVEPLAAEMTRWLTDGALYESAKAKARPFVRERYDWLQIARRWQRHYSDLIDRGRSRP